MNDYKYKDIWFEDTRDINNKQELEKLQIQYTLVHEETPIYYHHFNSVPYSDLVKEFGNIRGPVFFDFDDIIKTDISKKSYDIRLPLWGFTYGKLWNVEYHEKLHYEKEWEKENNRWSELFVKTDKSCMKLTPFFDIIEKKIVFAWICEEKGKIPNYISINNYYKDCYKIEKKVKYYHLSKRLIEKIIFLDQNEKK